MKLPLSTESVIGQYGLGERNERGKPLIQFCDEIDGIIMKTRFKLSQRRLYTWKSPYDGYEQRIIRNQIVSIAKTYPDAGINSNHNLLCSN